MTPSPASLDAVLGELTALDQQMTGHCADAGSLGQILERRAQLIAQASAVLDQLHNASPQQREQLRKSENAGNALLRQLIMTKHVLARELSQLTQERRFWDATGTQQIEHRSNVVDIAG